MAFYQRTPTGFWRYADTVGDGSGTINFNGDYSGGGAEQAILTAATGQRLMVVRLIVSAEDTTGMKADEYGNLGAALGNGIEIKHIDDDGSTVVNDMTDAVPVTTNAEWGYLCYDVDIKSWGQTPSNDFLVVRWTFERAGITGVLLEPGQSMRVFMNDDLDGLISHRFMFQGFDSNTGGIAT